MDMLLEKTETQKGLTEQEVAASRLKYGSNKLIQRKRKSFISQFFQNLGDPVIKILLAALVMNIIFSFRDPNWAETVGIAISVFLAAFISTLSERGGEAAFARLSAENSRIKTRVIRSGKPIEISGEDVVVGDVVILAAGDKIPADCRLLSGALSVDQSPMTGESAEVEKTPAGRYEKLPSCRSALFGGCNILSGEGRALVTDVGEATFLGGITRDIQLEKRESPLKLRLTKLASQISRIGYVAAFLVAFAFLFNTFIIDFGFSPQAISEALSDTHFLFDSILHAVMLGLTVIVVAVPEGLPMMIAVVLSSNIKKMTRDMVLVRKPVGIESAGSMNILFTDKTGTLTEGKISVDKLLLADGEEISGISELKRQYKPLFELYRNSCFLNTSAMLSGKKAVGGNSTDRALLESVAVYKSEFERDTAGSKIRSKTPFDSRKKYSSVTLSSKSDVTFVKGAPDVLMAYITSALDRNGSAVSFDRRSFEQRVDMFSARGYRVILIALGSNARAGGGLGELTLLCAAVLADRVKFEAKSAVAELQRAGIQVVMVTGDGKSTAENIARACGILNSGNNISLTSEELSRLDDESVAELLPQLAVISRALPSDKNRLVQISQSMGLVTGMTGDGINDAPALKRADVGFAMGSGTQVAREAGDIIVLDDNLSSIARAVLYGRNIFKSIRKFITLQLTMNFYAVGISMLGPFVGIDAPVTVVQMLWVNLIMDTLGGLAFAGEYPLASCMKEKPKRRDEPILNGYMVNQILVLGGFMIALCLAFLKLDFFAVRFTSAPDNIYHLTGFFAFFIFAGVFNCFNARTDRINIFTGLSKNRVFGAIMLSVLVLQIVFVYIGGAVLRTAPLSLYELSVSLAPAFWVFPADLIRKIILRLSGKKIGY